MEKDLTDPIAYYLVMDITHKDNLGVIRNWNTLKVAFEDKKIWVTGLDAEQIQTTEIKSIPFKSLYYEKGGKLFFLGSLLPERTVPSLLWSPIERALQIKLPTFNYNYFGIKEKVKVKMIASEKECESTAMITTIDILGSYIEAAPAVRLQNLYWVVLDNEKAFILGEPLLPVRGETYYQNGDFIIPAGYDFDLYILMEQINRVINPNRDYWIIWNRDTTYFRISKTDVEPLSIGAFRKTTHRFSYI